LSSYKSIFHCRHPHRRDANFSGGQDLRLRLVGLLFRVPLAFDQQRGAERTRQGGRRRDQHDHPVAGNEGLVDGPLHCLVEIVLGDLAEGVVNASTAVACGIVLIGEREGTVNLFGSYGFPECYTAGLAETYRAGAKSPNLEALRSRRPVLVYDLRAYILADSLYAPVHRFVREAPWDIAYSLPLVSRGRALGAIFFCFLPEAEPGEDEKVFLRAVADQAAVAVQNARLFSEARGKAALEERQRLAESCTTPSPRPSTA
jgi:GAF domain-containing protein